MPLLAPNLDAFVQRNRNVNLRIAPQWETLDERRVPGPFFCSKVDRFVPRNQNVNLSGADILILARTDARDGLGLEEALERLASMTSPSREGC